MESRRRRRLARILAALAVAGIARAAGGQQCTGSVQLLFDGAAQATIGVAYSGRFTLQGASGAVSFTQSAGQLPPGLQFQVVPAVPPSATISGTPTQAGVFVFTVIGREVSTDSTCGRAFTITVGTGSRISVAPETLPDGALGQSYDRTLTASGGTAPYSFTLIGALPPGLALGADGRISGSPSVPGAFVFGLEVSDAASPAASLRIDYSLLVTATAQPRLEITLHDGGVPWGRSAGGVIPYEVVYANRGSAAATGPVITVILDGAVSDACDIADLDPAGGALARSLEFQVPDLAPGATARFLLRETVCLSRVEGIVGTDPLAIETYQVVSQASIASRETSSDASVAVTPYCENVACATFCPLRYLSGYPCVEIGISPTSALLTATVGSPFLQSFVASHGTAPYVCSARDLPSGLSMSPDGTLSGTPTGVGRFDFTVGMTDASPTACHAEKTYRLDVCGSDNAPFFSPEANAPSRSYRLPDAVAQRTYYVTLDVLCGTPPYRFDSLTGLPEGLTLSSGGSSTAVLTGRPVNAGDAAFSIRITDAAGRTHDATYDLHVGHCFLEFSPQELPPATVGQSYSAPLSISGGTSPYRLVAVLPHCGFDGCGINTQSDISKLLGIYDLHVDNVSVSGTPSEAGRPMFTAYFEDSSTPTCFGSVTYTLEIRSAAAVCPPIDIAPADLPPAQVGVAYSAPLAATGGSGPYRFGSDRLRSDSGLVVDPSGVVVGTPAREGDLDFDAFAQDASVCVGVRTYSISVAPNPACAPIYVGPRTLPAGTAGVPYTGTSLSTDRIIASGGVRPYRYALATMPPDLGLSLDAATGELTGSPGRQGTYSFTVTATDSNPAGPCSGSQHYRIDIGPGLLSPAKHETGIRSRGLLERLRGAAARIRDAVVSAAIVIRDLPLYYRVRDQVLARTPGGRELIRLYYRHGAEITGLLKSDATLRGLAITAIQTWEPQLRSLTAGFGSDVRFTQPMSDAMNALLARLRQTGSPGLASDIAAQQASLDFSSWVGLSMEQARSKLEQRSCVTSDSALCLNVGRFRVEAAWLDFAGNTGPGHAVSLTGNTGYFWFFTANNVELVVKALDGRAVNDRFWLFYGALSNVEYTLTVTDTVTGAVKTYRNASGQLASVADTDAFPGH